MTWLPGTTGAGCAGVADSGLKRPFFNIDIQTVDRLFVPPRNEMPIEIHGDLDGTMAHLFLHIHGTLAVLEQEGGERMAEIMEAHLPNAGALQQPEEPKPHPVLMEGLALTVTEDPGWSGVLALRGRV